MAGHRIARLIYNHPWAVLPETQAAIREGFETWRAEGASTTSVQRENHFSAEQLQLSAPTSRGSQVYRRGAMAFIPVSGIIGKRLSMLESMCGGYDVDQLAQDVDEVAQDQGVSNVLFAFDSPGGVVTGVPETARLMRDLAARGKNTYAFTDTLVASAAYWLYSQAQNRYATESAEVGGVGVYAYLLDRTNQLKNAGVEPTVIRAGKFKAEGMPGVPLSDEGRAHLQDQVDSIYKVMTQDITGSHDVPDEALQGLTYMGEQAKKMGLVDATVSSLGSLVALLA